MGKVGFYAGSFDPFTNGHLHVIEVSSKIFDKVIVGIGVNILKARRFDQNKMKEAMEKVIKANNLDNVEVITYDNLTVDSAKEHGANYLIRGIRNGMDYDYEENIALINEEISGIDTIYVRARKTWSFKFKYGYGTFTMWKRCIQIFAKRNFRNYINI